MAIASTLGPYLLNGLLGEGGTAWVFLARHQETRKQVAAKVLKPTVARDAGVQARFRREARLGQEVRSRHVMRVHESGQQSGLHYMVLELLKGVPLSDAVRVKGRLPWPQATALCLQAAKGLRDLHGQGIVHRDIKPHNLFATRDGTVKLMDLGLAKRRHGESGAEGDEPATAGLTLAGTAMGTPAYMAPEQVIDSVSVGPQADTYSLGATLYHLLIGRTPFTGETVSDVLQQVLHHDASLPRGEVKDLPRPLADLIDRCLAKSPLRRPANGAELVEELREILDRFAPDTPQPTLRRQRTEALAAERE